MQPTRLAILNAHPRDAHIEFDEGPHIYTIDGDSDYKSVTTWNHSHFKDFDGDAIATKIIERLAANPDPSNKYHGMTKEQDGKSTEMQLPRLVRKCTSTLSASITI